MAGIAVIRLSGPQAFPAARSLTGQVPVPRQAARRLFRNPETQDVLDELTQVYESLLRKLESTPFEELLKPRHADDPEKRRPRM